ncbi:inner membrane protein YpjD, partial [Stenotrophomonas geniculata]
MTIVLIAVLLYLAASALLVRALGRDETSGSPIWLWPALPAMLLHGGYHVMVAMRTNGGPDMHFFAALSLVGLGMAWLTSLVGARGRMSALGVVVFPLAAVLLLAYHGYGHEPSKVLGWRLASHAWLALLAYATLSIAALLAIMLWLQERA